MLPGPQENDQEKKKVLKKVRTHFLAKRPISEEHAVVPVPKPRDPYTMYMINGAWAIVEQDRQLWMGTKYLNSCHDVTDIKILDSLHSRQVILKFQISNQGCLLPWEYSVKRLESYGNLELATMAHKIRTFNGNWNSLIEEFQKMDVSRKTEISDCVEKARINTMKYKEKIESMYPYSRTIFSYDKNGANFHSFIVSEALLKEIGQNAEGFAEWAQSHGIPALYNNQCHNNLDFGKKFLSQSIPIFSEINEEPEGKIYLCDLNGNKKRVVSQFIRISEPTKDGFIVSHYRIVKSSKPCDISEEAKEEYGHRETKYLRYESEIGKKNGNDVIQQHLFKKFI